MLNLLEALGYFALAAGYLMWVCFLLGYFFTPIWDALVAIWFTCFAGNGKENAPYAKWYDDEVRPLLEDDPRMTSLSSLTLARLRRRAIKIARFGPKEHYGEEM
jgi:hypothetical protein